MPNNPRGGVSRRVEGEERQELRETMDKLDLPPGMSVIARTAGIGRSVEELQWDLNYLMQLWRAIEGAGKSASGAFLIYQESSLVIRAIRDYFQPDIGEILIDTDEIYEQAHQFMSHVMPDMVHRVKRYSDDVPLFSRFQIEHQIETAYSRTVPLPSGGAIVIDHTEALVSVDVNSARATRGSDIETTAFNTNCEAAEEVARQLRLRDLGGLIVIDFIDMEVAKNQREVEQRLKDAAPRPCPRPDGQDFPLRPDGTVAPAPASVAVGRFARDLPALLGHRPHPRYRIVRAASPAHHPGRGDEGKLGHHPRASAGGRGRLPAQRKARRSAEDRNAPPHHHHPGAEQAPGNPHYKLERIKHDDPRLEDSQASYNLAEQAETDMAYSKRQKEEAKPRQEAMVKTITPEQPAPMVDRKPTETVIKPAPAPAPAPAEQGFFAKLIGFFTGKPAAPALPQQPTIVVKARPTPNAATATPVAHAAATVTAKVAVASVKRSRRSQGRRQGSGRQRPSSHASRVRRVKRASHASRQ
jgi:ribonuclease E